MQIITRLLDSGINDDLESQQKPKSGNHPFSTNIDQIITSDMNKLRDVGVLPAIRECIRTNEGTILIHQFDKIEEWKIVIYLAFAELRTKLVDDDYIEVCVFDGGDELLDIRVNNGNEFGDTIEGSVKQYSAWLLIRFRVPISGVMKTLNVLNVVDNKSLDYAEMILDEIQFANTQLNEYICLSSDTCTFIVNVDDEKENMYRSFEFVKQLMEIKQSVNDVSVSEDEESVEQVYKLKYDNALRKMISLETQAEMMHIDDDTVDLVTENQRLRQQVQLYEEMLQHDVSGNSQMEKYMSQKARYIEADSDVQIYKKLLVSKTDKILQLEYELEKLNQTNLKLKKQNSLENMNKDSKENTVQEGVNKELESTLAAMTETIQYQNVQLLKEVERVESELREKENLLKDTNEKWLERNDAVSIEQHEVENKLKEMGQRFRNLLVSADKPNTSTGSIDIVKSPGVMHGHDRSISQVNAGINETIDADSGKRRGLNLSIIKPF